MTLVNIPLYEEFTDPLGRWGNYDTEDLDQRDQLVKQEHVDLRSFVNDVVTHPASMLDLDQILLTTLDGDTMGDLEGFIVTRSGEGWTAGTLGPQSDRNNWDGISLECTTVGLGITTTASVMWPVDISAFADTDVISIALPAFTPASFDLTQCYLDLTSHPTGDFTAGPTDTIAFNESTTTLSSGDVEARFPLSLLVNVDRTAIIGVRFRMKATTLTTLRALAIRVLGPDWEYPGIDANTLYDEGRLPVTLNGSATIPTETLSPWPVIYRADGSAQGDPADPMPIDLSISCLFTPGSLTIGDNDIALYFREQPLDEQIQLDLDGITQAALDAGLGQPDLGRAAYRPRIQSDIDPLDQAALDDDSQFYLERQPDYVQDTYIKVELQWSDTSGILTIKDANDNGYTFDDVTLTARTAYRVPLYALVVDLEDNHIRVQIFELDSVGQIQSVVYDTTQITDSEVLKRRRGRFGWSAQFADGDASILSIRPRKANFGTVVTKEFRSNTPVEGARLVVGATPDRELVTGIGSSPWGGAHVTSDPTKTRSGKAYKIQTSSFTPLQGIQTNEFRVEDIDNIEIRFSIFFPSSGLPKEGRGLEVFLLGHDLSIVPLNVTSLKPDRWEDLRISLPTDRVLGGLYRLVIVQTTPLSNVVWWIDKLSIISRIVTWEGRGEKPDAWETTGSQWVPYRSTVNKEQAGILYEQRGKGLQVKAVAHQQDAQIDSLKVVPRYAELGRFRWRDDEPIITGDPATPTIPSPTINGKTVTFTGSSTTPHNSIIAYYWSFGDDQFTYGPTVAHTYAIAGTYTVTLVVIDDQYRQSTQTTTVTV